MGTGISGLSDRCLSQDVRGLENVDLDGRTLHVRARATRPAPRTRPRPRPGARAVPLSPRARKILRGLDLPIGGDYRQARLALVAAMGPLHKEGMGWHTIRAAHSSLLDVASFTLRDASARMGHGHNYAQTLAYRVRSESGDARALDRARER